MNVLIAGGGTGGHLFPGLALAQELRRRDATTRIVFVGTRRGIETRAVPKAGFDLELLPVVGLRRTGVLGLIKGLAMLPLALWRALALVRRFRPDVAVSCGGYAAGPAVMAARILGVPCVVMEQNAVPGFTNRVLGKFAQLVIAALPTRGFAMKKVRVLGNPVRHEFLAVRDLAYEPGRPLNVLVFGGSQGARALNEAMMALAPSLNGSLKIVHQTGRADEERVRRAYELAGSSAEVTAFIDDMADAYRNADLVLARAGATTIAELTVCGRPAVLVPFPFAVDDHQTKNALTMQTAGAAIHLAQSELTADKLRELLGELAGDPSRLRKMARSASEAGHPDAARNIADAIEELVQGGKVSDV